MWRDKDNPRRNTQKTSLDLILVFQYLRNRLFAGKVFI